MRRFRAERQRGDHVGAEVDGEDLRDRQGERHAEQAVAQIRDDFRHVAHQDVGGELANVGVDGPPFLDRVHDGGEVVVEQHHVGRFLGHVGAGDAHGDADVGFLERRRVVDAVPRDGDHLAHLFQERDDPHLLPWRHAGEDGLGFSPGLGGEEAAQGLVVHCIQALTFHDRDEGAGLLPIAYRHEADLPPDGQRRQRMVAGDHDDADPGLAAARDRLRHFPMRRIDHGHESEEGKRTLDRLRRQGLGAMRDVPRRHSEHAIGLLRKGAALEEELFPFSGRHRTARPPLHDVIAQGNHELGGALDQGHQLALDPVNRAHALAVGIEGDLVHAGKPLAVGDAEALNELGEGDFGRIALPEGLAAMTPNPSGVVAERERLEEPLPLGQGLGMDAAPVAHERALSNVDDGAVDEQLLDPHPILGERAGLVRADHGRAAERLDRGQVLDERLPLRHSLTAHREGERDGGQEAFRHVGHDDPNAEDRADPKPEAGGEPDEEKERAHSQREEGDDVGDMDDLALERRRPGVGARGETGDLSEFGAHARGVDHGAAPAGEDRRAGQHEIGRVGEIGMRRDVGRAPFGPRFARERGQVHAEPDGVDQAGVGGDLLAFLQHQQVPADDGLAWNLMRVPAAEHPGGGGEELMERLNGAFRLVLLREGEQGVDDDHSDNRPTEHRHPLAGVEALGHKGQAGGRPEQHSQKMGELLQEQGDDGNRRRGLQAIGAVSRQTAACLIMGKAGRRTVNFLQELGFGD